MAGSDDRNKAVEVNTLLTISGNPDEIPEKKIIISNLRSKPLIVFRNMVKTEEILRFEEKPEKSGKNP